jgi:hypothetical protein
MQKNLSVEQLVRKALSDGRLGIRQLGIPQGTTGLEEPSIYRYTCFNILMLTVFLDKFALL